MRMSLLIFYSCVVLFAAEQDEVPVLRWAGPPGSRPGTYEEWICQHPYMPFVCDLDRIANGNGLAGTVALLTEGRLAVPLSNAINQLVNNLQSEGHTVLSYQVSGGTPETLRAFLKDLYDRNRIEGALFIGNLPVAWFEIANDYGNMGYTHFPIDLFYMDLNGTWLDTMNTGNGRFDGHIDSINPEIYVGRLIPNGMGDDTVLLKNYFLKDNRFRHDTLLLRKRALFFCDDDWIPWAPGWAYDLSVLYADTMNYWDAETTKASVYRAKLDTVQAWVSVFAHSWPGGHQFRHSGGYDYYYSTEYSSQNPPANFYNFFACSFSRYTDAGNGGATVIFNQDYGLGSIGTTKTGSMLEFYYFYEPLSQGKNLGQAFKDWFTYITDDGVTFMELCWHYGMTLLADPFLKPLGHVVSVHDNEPGQISVQAFQLRIIGNPLSSTIKMSFNLDQAGVVKIDLYDCSGRVKSNLLNQRLNTGPHFMKLPMLDQIGKPLPGGVYIMQFRHNNTVLGKKIIKV